MFRSWKFDYRRKFSFSAKPSATGTHTESLVNAHNFITDISICILSLLILRIYFNLFGEGGEVEKCPDDDGVRFDVVNLTLSAMYYVLQENIYRSMFSNHKITLENEFLAERCSLARSFCREMNVLRCGMN